MIANRPLTYREQNAAQSIYIRFSGMRTLGGSCSGMTVQILLALYLGISDAAVSCIGTFSYLNYLVLPAGFYFAGKYGVAKSMQKYTRINAAACLLIALAAVSPILGLRSAGISLFFAGLFFLYAMDACTAATGFALPRNIAGGEKRPRFFSLLLQLNSMAGLAANLVLAGIFGLLTNAAALPLLYCMAAVLYFLNGRTIIRMPEPAVLQKLSARPMLPQVKTAWQSPLVRRILLVGLIQNLVFVTMLPVNLLVVKRGCGIDNTHVLILTSIQLAAMFLLGYGYRYLGARIGPRRIMIAACPFVWMLAAYWVLVPAEHLFSLLIPPFVLTSVITIGLSTAMGNYITDSVPNELQVGASILVFLIHGGAVGLIGLIANPVLFKILAAFAGTDPMALYRRYYLITGLISLPGIFAFISLPKKIKKE